MSTEKEVKEKKTSAIPNMPSSSEIDTAQKSLYDLSFGDSLYIDEDFSGAVDAYSTSLASDSGHAPKSVRFRMLSHRSASLIRLGKYVLALEDANAAVGMLPLDKHNDDITVRSSEEESCRMRLGLAHFHLEHNSEAKRVFESLERDAAASGKDGERFRIMIEKCKSKIPVNTAKPTQSVKNVRPTMPKYQYYQNDTIMTISILERKVTSDSLKVTFDLDKLKVILTKNGVDFTVICGTLFDAVEVSKCKVKIMDEKVLIKLRKREKHDWHELFGSGARDKEEEDDKVTKTPTDNVAKVTPIIDSTKTRPYASHRDWNAIGKDLKKQEENEKPEGDEALNKLFKDIYGKANEDTKRAMVKSMQTSGGTVLSTNWDDVKKADYEKERQAPKGMEWKNWEGDKLPQKEN